MMKKLVLGLLVLVTGLRAFAQPTPKQIVSAGAPFNALSQQQLDLAEVALLSQLAYGTVQSPATVLGSARAWNALSQQQLDVAEAVLLSQLAYASLTNPGAVIGASGAWGALSDRGIRQAKVTMLDQLGYRLLASPAQLLGAGAAWRAASQQQLGVAKAALLNQLTYNSITNPAQIVSASAGWNILSSVGVQQAQAVLLAQLVGNASGSPYGPPPADLKTVLANPANVLAVISSNGVDGTAVRGDLSKPWKTLSVAAAAAKKGDVIVVYPGNNDTTATALIPANCRVLGFGSNLTFIRYFGVTANPEPWDATSTTYCMMPGGDNVTVEGVTVLNMAPTFPQCALGTRSGLPGYVAFTNLTVKDSTLNSSIDGIYIVGFTTGGTLPLTPFSVNILNSLIVSTWDGLTPGNDLNGDPIAIQWNLVGSTFVCLGTTYNVLVPARPITYPGGLAGVNQNIIANYGAEYNTVNAYGCTFTSSDAPVGLFDADPSDDSMNFYGCSIVVTNIGNDVGKYNINSGYAGGNYLQGRNRKFISLGLPHQPQTP